MTQGLFEPAPGCAGITTPHTCSDCFDLLFNQGNKAPETQLQTFPFFRSKQPDGISNPYHQRTAGSYDSRSTHHLLPRHTCKQAARRELEPSGSQTSDGPAGALHRQVITFLGRHYSFQDPAGSSIRQRAERPCVFQHINFPDPSAGSTFSSTIHRTDHRPHRT
jgi:hypothetical protein